jgi:TRAP-type transport system periplasmic protein
MLTQKKANGMGFPLIMVLASFAVLLSFSLLEAAQAAEQEFDLKLATTAPSQHFLYNQETGPYSNFVKGLQEKTGGRVKIKIYFSGVLGKTRDSFDMIKSGMVDMSDFIPNYVPGYFPLTSIGQLPFTTAGKSHKGVEIALNQLLKKGLLDKEYDNAKMLIMGTTDPLQLFLKKKITKMEDLRGLKVSSDGDICDDILRAWGVTPLPMPTAEIYMALEKGVLDGAMRNWAAAPAWKLHEVTKYVVETNVTCTPIGIGMSLKAWNQLPPDIKKIWDAWSEESVGSIVYGAEDRNIMGYEIYGKRVSQPLFVSKGVELTQLPPSEMRKMQSAVVHLWDKWIENMEAKKLPGKKLMQEYLSILNGLGVEPIYKLK